MNINITPGMSIGPGANFKVPYTPLTANGLLYNFDASKYSGSGDWIDGINGIHATPVNGPTWSSNNGGIFTLNGSNQYFSVPYDIFLPTYTLDVWFNLTGIQSGLPCLVSDAFNGGYINFTVSVGDNYLVTGWYGTNWGLGNGGQYATNNTQSKLVSDGSTWYNLVMAVDTTKYKDYINGSVSYDPGNFGSGSAPIGHGAGIFYIGKRWDGDDSVLGNIAVVNVYDHALTDQEVATNFKHYKSRFGL